ncbi:cytochrome b/b6 domain-containing protein [Achromobacter spanius]|uniref:Cytochrome B n=1 Tax=Achromobacter spanius TaxID=217203 RepID=A0A2S0I6Y2_9BURK|nr:cytochrome b/b6 domain-containing protein [Achromobacter spanius]AVJ27789.1 cytochrome B [Achromobacter spanius]
MLARPALNNTPLATPAPALSPVAPQSAAPESDAKKRARQPVPPAISPVIHPRWLRVTHWLNALAVVVMIMSGWRIYNAAPFFDFTFPNGITLGGWLGGALQWHFAGMWLLFFNGLLYLALNVATGRLWRKFLPVSPGGVVRDLLAALRGRLSHADPRRYNQVQRLAYLFVMADIAVLILSGLVLWKSVQFDLLRDLMGGYEAARRVHFFAMALLAGFVAVHLAMVALVPRSLLTMIRGK